MRVPRFQAASKPTLDADQDRQRFAREDQNDGAPDSLGEKLPDILTVGERDAEIALQQIAHVGGELAVECAAEIARAQFFARRARSVYPARTGRGFAPALRASDVGCETKAGRDRPAGCERERN